MSEKKIKIQYIGAYSGYIGTKNFTVNKIYEVTAEESKRLLSTGQFKLVEIEVTHKPMGGENE